MHRAKLLLIREDNRVNSDNEIEDKIYHVTEYVRSMLFQDIFVQEETHVASLLITSLKPCS